MKVNAFVLNLRKEFEIKRQTTQPAELNIIESIEEKLADAELTRLLTELETSQLDASEKSLSSLIQYFKERDKVVGKQYNDKPNHLLNIKCYAVALQISITTGKKRDEVLMPAVPKERNNQTGKMLAYPVNHHGFIEKKFVSDLIVADFGYYKFDNFQKQITTKEQLLDVLENYVLPSDRSSFLNKMPIDRLKVLLLGEGVNNYSELMSKLEGEIGIDTLSNAHYYCLTFLYNKHRAIEPDLITWRSYVGGLFVSTDNRKKDSKLDVSKEILTALENQDRSVILAAINEVAKKPAAGNGFTYQLIEKLKLAFAPAPALQLK